MGLRKVNVNSVELDETLNEAGFRHVGAALQKRLGAHRIGASVYSAGDGDTIWPYHYHHGMEEWLYVISGEPVLRDPDGQRKLAAGDVVCFPSGPGGAHTLRGPGRFVIFSTGEDREPLFPVMSVYPDSDKVAGPEGILLRSSAVDYWYGEGTWTKPAPGPRREAGEAELLPRPPILNLGSLEPTPPEPAYPPGFRTRAARFGPDLKAELLGATLYELDPGEGTAPYHYEGGREEWLLVLSGAPTLRHPGGEDGLDPGDVVCFVDGAAGAHRVLNRSDTMARLVFLSTMDVPSTAHYPDSGKLLIRDAGGGGYIFRKADEVDYWDGETATGSEPGY